MAKKRRLTTSKRMTTMRAMATHAANRPIFSTALPRKSETFSKKRIPQLHSVPARGGGEYPVLEKILSAPRFGHDLTTAVALRLLLNVTQVGPELVFAAERHVVVIRFFEFSRVRRFFGHHFFPSVAENFDHFR